MVRSKTGKRLGRPPLSDVEKARRAKERTSGTVVKRSYAQPVEKRTWTRKPAGIHQPAVGSVFDSGSVASVLSFLEVAKKLQELVLNSSDFVKQVQDLWTKVQEMEHKVEDILKSKSAACDREGYNGAPVPVVEEESSSTSML